MHNIMLTMTTAMMIPIIVEIGVELEDDDDDPVVPDDITIESKYSRLMKTASCCRCKVNVLIYLDSYKKIRKWPAMCIRTLHVIYCLQ